MNVSYNWLKDYVETGLGYVEAAKRLTQIGLNVDSIEDLPGDDGRLEVEVTSNRPDCLGHIGVARELAAAVGTKVRLPETSFEESGPPAADLVKVDIDDLDLCLLYTARVIRGVKIGPSPDWLARRLEAIGLRPVNNVVDVTNYVMMECGQPLHAFDFAGIQGGRIIVRRARASISWPSTTASTRWSPSGWSSPTPTGPWPWRASWAGPRPRSATRPPTSCSRRPCSTP